jgi:hypothetical protein
VTNVGLCEIERLAQCGSRVQSGRSHHGHRVPIVTEAGGKVIQELGGDRRELLVVECELGVDVLEDGGRRGGGEAGHRGRRGEFGAQKEARGEFMWATLRATVG